MGADITLDRLQYPASITVGESVLGYPTLWIHDGCFDVAVRLSPATARALAEQLLAYKSGCGFDTGSAGDGEGIQASSELEAPLGQGQADPVAAPGDADDATAAVRVGAGVISPGGD